MGTLIRENTVFLLLSILLLTTGWAFADSRVIIDRSGNEISAAKPFTRIISLYGAHTENLFVLGLDQELIGVGGNETYPPKAIEKPVFSYHDDAEKFLAACPDLVLIRPMIALGYQGLVDKLKRGGILVVSLQPRGVNEMYDYWKVLGRLVGKEREAEQMVERFEAGLAAARSTVETIPATRRKRVYFEAIHSKMKTFAPNSMAVFVLEAAGGLNVAGDAVSVRGTNIAAYGKERILAQGDRIDVYLAQTGTMNSVTLARIRKETGFMAIKAVRNNNIYFVDEQIVCRPTLRLLHGIYEIGRILYPERFGGWPNAQDTKERQF